MEYLSNLLVARQKIVDTYLDYILSSGNTETELFDKFTQTINVLNSLIEFYKSHL